MVNWIEMVVLDPNNKRGHVFQAWIRLIQKECEININIYIYTYLCVYIYIYTYLYIYIHIYIYYVNIYVKFWYIFLS